MIIFTDTYQKRISKPMSLGTQKIRIKKKQLSGMSWVEEKVERVLGLCFGSKKVGVSCLGVRVIRVFSCFCNKNILQKQKKIVWVEQGVRP